MAVVRRAPLKAPDFRAYVNAAAFAACIVGLSGSAMALVAPVAGPFAQSDWPVPQKAPARFTAILPAPQNLLQTTLVTPNDPGRAYEYQGPAFRLLNVNALRPTVDGFSVPIRTYANLLNDANKRPSDWPVPKGPQRSVSLLTWTQNLLQSTLAPVPPNLGPDRQTEWPVPPGPAPRSVSLFTWTQNLQQSTLAPAPTRLTEWPVPAGPQRSISLLTWTQNLLESTLTPAAAATLYGPAYEVRGPHFIVRAAQTLTATNLQQTTLATPAVTAPFNQEDWLVPRSPQRGVERAVFGTPLALVQAQGNNQFDWPVPKAKAPLNVGDVEGFPEPIRDYAGGLNSANRPRPDWPNPRAPQPLNVGFIDSLTPLPLAAVAVTPFEQSDWPNPRAPRPLNVGFVQGSLPSFLQLQGYNQFDWPVPKVAPPLNLGWVQGFPEPIRGFAGGLNDGRWRNLDWPNPRGALPNQPLSWTQDLQQTPFTSPPIPAPAQRDWPNPGLGKPPLNVGWVSGFPLPILNYAVGLNDGRWRNLDWPVPRGAQRPVVLLTWLQPKTQPAPFSQSDWPVPKGLGPRQALSIGFPTPIRDYAGGLNDANKRPSDWPVPKGPQRSIDALTWTQTLALQLSQAPVKPFVQNDWPLPVPKVYRQIAETRGFETPVRNYAVGLNDANKRKYDWPNPIGKPPLNVGFVQGFPETIQTAQVLRTSLRNYDWPVPRGFQPLNRGRVQGFDASDLIRFIPFAYLRNYDWPVPKGPRAAIDLRTWTINLLEGTLAPSPFVPVCAHVEILWATTEVNVVFGDTELEVLAAQVVLEPAVADADTDVLTNEAIVSIDECPGEVNVVPPPAEEVDGARVTEDDATRLTEDDITRIIES